MGPGTGSSRRHVHVHRVLPARGKPIRPRTANRTAATITTAVFIAGLGVITEADGAQRGRLLDGLRQVIAAYWSTLDNGDPAGPAG